MKYFLAYYIISGIITSVLVYKKRKHMMEQCPEATLIGSDIMVLFNFLTGFIQLPFIVPLEIILFFKNRKIKKLEKEIARRNMPPSMKNVDEVTGNDDWDAPEMNVYDEDTDFMDSDDGDSGDGGDDGGDD